MLIVDDSVVARSVFGRILIEDGRFEIAGEAASAERALALLEHTACEIILLDIEMPGISGIDAIPLMRKKSDAAIIVLSSQLRDGADASMRAMTQGATDTLPKPGSGDLATNFANTFTRTLGRIADARCPGPYPAAKPQRQLGSVPDSIMIARPVRCVAIGASTGGVHAMLELLEAIPSEIIAPILVTQHLPGNFIEPFSRQMELATTRQFAPAREGQLVAPGQVLVAPGDAHLTVQIDGDAVRIRFRRDQMPTGCMPSVDPMFSSVARIYGPDSIGVILSGMGRDGAAGARALAEVGAELLVQDRDSSVVWGMPGAVDQQGIASLVADPASLGRHVARRAGAHGWL